TGAPALPPQTRLDQVVTDSAYLSTLAALLAGLSPGNPVSTGVAQYSGQQFGATEFGGPEFRGPEDGEAEDGEAEVGEALSNPRWLQWSIRAIHDDDGSLSQYQAIVEDITEARLAEDLMRDYQVELAAQVETRTRELEVANRSLERRAEEIAAITGVAQALASATDPVPVLQEVAQLLCRLLDARGVGINVYDISAQTRTLIAWHPPQGHARMRVGTVRPLSEYLYRVRLLGERRTISVARDANTPEAAQIRDVMIDEEVNTLIVAPMLVRSEVVGDILITTARQNWRLRESDLRLVETIAGQLAASLELGRLLSAEQRERLRAEGLHEVAKMINRSLDPTVVMSVVLSELAKVTDFDGASIWLREGDELWLAEATGQAVPYAGQRIAVGTRSAVGEVFHQRTTVAIEDTLTDARWARWFPEYAMRSWMGAPMVADGEVIGALCIERLAPGRRAGDAPLLQALADSAAIAVVNARLYKQAQVVAAVEERERLARDLHDAVTQTIFSASILAEALPLQLQTQPARAEETVEALQLLTRGALAEMRSLLMELRPNGLSEVSLETLIKHLTDALAGKSSIQTQLSGNWQLIPLPEEVQVTFYRIAQEALNNIAKHAEASEATVELSNGNGWVSLHIEDNGRGFDVGAAQPGHFGLQIMRERAVAIGAHFDIESRPGAGTRIRLEWHAQPEEEE
ncbi:MAG: GAF domain-containing protein, partial [Caldilineaceae bacterium]